jgi:hypothetical protein
MCLRVSCKKNCENKLIFYASFKSLKKGVGSGDRLEQLMAVIYGRRGGEVKYILT